MRAPVSQMGILLLVWVVVLVLHQVRSISKCTVNLQSYRIYIIIHFAIFTLTIHIYKAVQVLPSVLANFTI